MILGPEIAVHSSIHDALLRAERETQEELDRHARAATGISFIT